MLYTLLYKDWLIKENTHVKTTQIFTVRKIFRFFFYFDSVKKP